MFRAVLGRPTLSGAAALAVVSVSTAGIAAATGQHSVALVASGPVGLSATDTLSSSAAVDPTGESTRSDGEQVAAADRVPSAEGRRALVAPGQFQAAQAALVATRKRLAVRASRAAHRKALLSRSPKVVARAMLQKYGWGPSQFGCLDRLWTRESKWSLTATNPSSGAYGIPQALPGTKMASVGSDWRTNPVTQISWGLGYIQSRYGSPCGAWGHSEGHGWY